MKHTKSFLAVTGIIALARIAAAAPQCEIYRSDKDPVRCKGCLVHP